MELVFNSLNYEYSWYISHVIFIIDIIYYGCLFQLSSDTRLVKIVLLTVELLIRWDA